MSDGLMVQSICSCIGAFFVGPKLAKRLGKKRACITSGIAAAASYLTLAFVGTEGWYYYIACTSFAALSLSLLGSVGIQLYLDAGEYQLFKTGKDNRPYVMSLQMVPMKFGMMISAPVVAQILRFSGYEQPAGAPPTMSDPDHMVLLIGIICASLAAAYFLILSTFKITEEKSKEYAAANQARLAEIAEAKKSAAAADSNA
jgi:Na+/melibiose symporter-like transporter